MKTTNLASYEQYMQCYADSLEHYWTMEHNKNTSWEAFTYNCWQQWKASYGELL